MDIKYAYYNTSKGYRVLGGTAVHFLKADGSLDGTEYIDKTSFQDIAGTKRFYTSGGNNYDNNSLHITSSDGSDPAITFNKIGTIAGQLKMNVAGYHFLNPGLGYYPVNAAGYVKSGSDDSYLLTGGGGHVPRNSFASGNYRDYQDNREINPNEISPMQLAYGFTTWDNDISMAHYADFLHFGGYTDASGGQQNLIAFNKNGFGIRQFQGPWQDGDRYKSYVDFWHSGNFDPNNYIPLSGTLPNKFFTGVIQTDPNQLTGLFSTKNSVDVGMYIMGDSSINNSVYDNNTDINSNIEIYSNLIEMSSVNGSNISIIRLNPTEVKIYNPLINNAYITPTTDNHYVQKKYVDDSIGTATGNLPYIPLTGTDNFSGRIANNNYDYIFGQDADYKARIHLRDEKNPNYSGTFLLYGNIEEGFGTYIGNPGGNESQFSNYSSGAYFYATDSSQISELFHDAEGLYNSTYKEPQSDNFYIQRKYVTDNFISSTGVSALLANYYTKSETYNKAEVDAKLSAVYRPKGSVANFASLPTTGNTEGDVWNVLDTGANYVWVSNVNNTGTPGWDKLSETVDLTNYVTLNTPQTIIGDKRFALQPVKSDEGFQNSVYHGGRNRIWSFGNADKWGLSYQQSGFVVNGTQYREGINFHFGDENDFKVHINEVGEIFSRGTIFTDSNGNSLQWSAAYNWGNHAGAGYALANGSNASGEWLNASKALSINPYVPGRTFNASGASYLQDATYGDVNGFLNSNGIAQGNPTDNWYHRIKMLHSNSSGYFTEIAVQMTGDYSMWYKKYENGDTNAEWVQLWDKKNFNPDSKDSAWLHSDRDFTQGTRILTNIDYSQWSGAAFLVEIKGNMYGGGMVMDCKIQGYIYNDTIINVNGYSTHPLLTEVIALNLNGELCFWFPRLSYWQGFSVKVTDVTSASVTTTTNRAYQIADTADPGGIKRVSIPIVTTATQSWVNDQSFVTTNTVQAITALKEFYTTLAMANGQSIYLKGSSDTAHYIRHFSDDTDGFGVSSGFAVKNYSTLENLFQVTSAGFGEFKQNVRAGGFLKTGSSNNFVLLGYGDHKPLSDFWTSANFNPASKVNAWENAYALGFSSGLSTAAPYIYHATDGYVFLATQSWVSSNFANQIQLNVEFTTNLGTGLMLSDNQIGGESGLIDIHQKAFIAGKIGEYYKYGSSIDGLEGINYDLGKKNIGIGGDIDSNKVRVEGCVKAIENFKSEDEKPDTMFIPDGRIATLRDEIVNEKYTIRLNPHEYEIDNSGFLSVNDRNRLIHIIGEQIDMVVDFKEIYPKQQIVIYNFDQKGNTMQVQIYGKTIYYIEPHCYLRLYVTDSLRVIAERQQPCDFVW